MVFAAQLVWNVWGDSMEVGNFKCWNSCIQPFLFWQKYVCIFFVLRPRSAGYTSATQRDGLCVDDTSKQLEKCAAPECFAQSKDIEHAFRELSAVILKLLQRLLIVALFYKLADNELPCPKAEQCLAESSLSPLFFHFWMSSAQCLEESLSIPSGKFYLTVDSETAVNTEAPTKMPDVTDGTIYLEDRRAEQDRCHTLTDRKCRKKLHEVSAKKKLSRTHGAWHFPYWHQKRRSRNASLGLQTIFAQRRHV